MGMKIGKEKPKMAAKPVIVMSFEKETVPASKSMKDAKEKFILLCKHPDSAELLKIQRVRYERRGGNMENAAMWLSTDADGNLSFDSAVAHLMRHYGLSEFEDIEGKTLQTVQDTESGFLIIKAY